MTPSQFENLVANRLDEMGYDVALTGDTNRSDGGIDLIATPKIRTVGSFVLAAHVKHHRDQRYRTGSDAVQKLLAWKDSPFRMGLLVTNTPFTRQAVWLANQERNRNVLRLRDIEDLRRWLADNFRDEKDWREIPNRILLAPGFDVEVHKAKLPFGWMKHD